MARDGSKKQELATGKLLQWRKGQAGEEWSEDTGARRWERRRAGPAQDKEWCRRLGRVGTRPATGSYGGQNGEEEQQEGQDRERGGGGAGQQETEVLKLLYTNAQSIQGKIHELAAISMDESPDIILLCETWCNSSVNDAAIALPNYQLQVDLRKDRTDTANGIGGGLLVYSKLGIEILPYDKFSDNEFNQFASFSVRTSSQILHVILIYRPPSSNAENMDKLCEILAGLDRNTIVIGDFNLPGIDWTRGTSDKKGRKLLDTVSEQSLIQLVDCPTHDKGNILDLLITNCPEIVLNISSETKLGKSDHCVLNVELDVNIERNITVSSKPNWSKWMQTV